MGLEGTKAPPTLRSNINEKNNVFSSFIPSGTLVNMYPIVSYEAGKKTLKKPKKKSWFNNESHN